MNKTELIKHVAKDTSLTITASEKAINSVFNGIKKTLKSGGVAKFIGFGTFSVVQRKARTGRNPRTGDAIKIPASKAPNFKAGAELKKAVN